MKKRPKTRRRRKPAKRRLRIQLYPYQWRWVEDDARFKIACKARQIGFTFAAAYRVVRKRLAQPGLTVWLSASERQALEAMEHAGFPQGLIDEEVLSGQGINDTLQA